VFAPLSAVADATQTGSSNDEIFMGHLLKVAVSAEGTLCEPIFRWDCRRDLELAPSCALVETRRKFVDSSENSHQAAIR
jgi:hypothetical protein